MLIDSHSTSGKCKTNQKDKQYTVLEAQSRSVNTRLLLGFTKISSNLSFLSK